MIHLLLLISLFHPSHRSQVVRDTLSELKRAAATVGEYQHNPPMLTSGNDDAMYVMRAEADITVALRTLSRYKHHQVSEQDLRSVVSQLERDLEDIPPAPAVIKDTRPTI